MKKLTLILILILSLSLILISCGGNTNDTSSDTQSSVNTDTQTDTNTDTNTDTSTDTSADTDTDTDDVPPVSDRPAINPEYQDEVDALLSSKHKLTYNDDGSFRVLIIADTHMNTNSASGAVNAVSDRIKILVDRVDPNLVIFTGDNTINSSSEEQLRKNIDKLVSYIEEKKIPWCHVYGNHDYENALATKYQQQIYESYEYCISKNTDELSGTNSRNC